MQCCISFCAVAKPTPAKASRVANCPRSEWNAQPATSNALDLAREWIAKQPPAVEGENGSGSCFAVACALVRDWALPRAAARALLAEYSERCLPPWSDSEIDHKLDDAEKAAAAEPAVIGWRVRQAENDDGDDRRRTGADRLMRIIKERTTLWHTPDREAYASIHHEGHIENYSVSSNMFSTWLGGVFLDHTEGVVKQNALTDAINTATGLAIHRGNPPQYSSESPGSAIGSTSISATSNGRPWRSMRTVGES